MIAALALAAALQTVTPTGWLVDDTSSALDGTRSLMIGREADAAMSNIIGRPEKAMLMLACVDGRRKVALQWPDFLGTGAVYVFWKVGEGEVTRTTFYPADGRLGLVDGRAAQGLYDALRTEQPLVMRVHAYRSTAEASFTMTGAGEYVTMAEEACPGKRRR